MNGKAQLQKPDLIRNVGRLTIAHLMNARNGKEHATLVQEWAEDVWSAYAVYHQLAKDWIERAKKEYKPK